MDPRLQSGRKRGGGWGGGLAAAAGMLDVVGPGQSATPNNNKARRTINPTPNKGNPEFKGRIATALALLVASKLLTVQAR